MLRLLNQKRNPAGQGKAVGHASNGKIILNENESKFMEPPAILHMQSGFLFKQQNTYSLKTVRSSTHNVEQALKTFGTIPLNLLSALHIAVVTCIRVLLPLTGRVSPWRRCCTQGARLSVIKCQEAVAKLVAQGWGFSNIKNGCLLGVIDVQSWGMHILRF